MKKLMFTALIFAVLISLFAACVPEDTSGTHKFVEELLFELKHPYIGAPPSDLLRLLGSPEGLESDGMVLHTANEPYGITLYYVCDNDTLPQYKSEKQINLQHNALIFLALIDNCSFVEFALQTESTYSQRGEIGDKQATVYRFDIAWADEAIGGKIKEAADTLESFAAFYANLSALPSNPVVPRESIE